MESLLFSGGADASGNPMWTTPTSLGWLSFPIRPRSAPVGIADLNNDGLHDVFVGHFGSASGFTAYIGDSRGHFTGATVNVSESFSYGDGSGFGVADLDGNGTSDIIAIRY